jgi:hypothetical protein
MRALLRSSLLLFAGCATTSPRLDPGAPPTVLTGEVGLVCNIDSQKEGVQRLTITEGGGIEFDAAVTPIVDGTVHLKGPDQGGVYRFTSHLARPVPAKLSGVGDVTLESLETKVSVTVVRYQQAGGPGTELSFRSEDMERRGIYIEFAGAARSPAGERYAFKTTLGAVHKGEGKVRPRDANYNSNLVAKAVMVEAPAVTTVIQSRTEVQRVP